VEPSNWRKKISLILVALGLGYFSLVGTLFFWLAPLEIAIAGIKISLVSLVVPLKVALGLLVAGLWLRYFDRSWFENGLILAGLGGLFFLIPHQLGGDGEVRFQGLTLFLESGRWPDMPYSFLGPLFSTPFYLLGKIVQTPEWWCSRYNVVLLALGLFLLHGFLKRQTERSLLRAFFLILLAGSMFPNHLRFYFGEVFTAVWVMVGTVILVGGRFFLGWTAVVLGVVNTPAALPAMGLLAFERTFQEKRFRHLLPLGMAVLLILLENGLRKGGFWATGYENNAGFATLLPYSGKPGFSYPFFFGLLSIFFSFGKGILFFAPGMFLPLEKWRSRLGHTLYTSSRLWVLLVLGLILIYAQWWSWYGGYFWGPRFFLLASLPASLVLAARLRFPEPALPTNLLTGLALSLSFWVGINGAVFDQQGLELCLKDQHALEFLCWYVPEFSVLWRPFVVPRGLGLEQELIIAYGFLVFLHLSLPLFNTTAGQVSRKIGELTHRFLRSEGWRI
jgi:hypothetical protein